MATRSTQRTRRKTAAENMSVYQNNQSGNSYEAAAGPYSLDAMLRFFTNNAGMIFIALSIFIIGFLGGSLWTENKMFKEGIKGSAGTLAAAPGTAAAPAAPAAPDAGPTALSDDDWKTVTEGGAGVIGKKDAKLTIVEFTDYQCPFCSRHFKETYPSLKKDYVDTGKAKIVLHDQPLTFHPNSRIGALAARCAADQGGLLGTAKDKNYEYMHDALFGKQDEWVNLSKDDAIKKYGEYAKAGGMNDAQLMDCVKNEKFGKDVDTDIALANKVGANGTPTFFVEKQPVVGAQPLASFQAILDKAQ
jgi:protein-disulfide isomerase